MATAEVSLPPPSVRHETSATITRGYSAVSFVPTEHVQTAVSVMDDHIVIDMIVPPTRYLPPTLTVARLLNQLQEDLVQELDKLGLGMGSKVASVAHPRSMYAEAEQFVRDVSGRLIDPALLPQNSSEYPRARLGIRSLRGEPLLTYFPDPAPAEPKQVNGSITTCPCVCCRSGCPGPDPRTKRLPLFVDTLAKDANGNTIVDVPPSAPATVSTSALAANSMLGEPFTEAALDLTSDMGGAAKPPSMPSFSKTRTGLPSARSTSNLPNLAAPNHALYNTNMYDNRAPISSNRDRTVQLPSTGSKPSSHMVMRDGQPTPMESGTSYDQTASQRAQKGMSLFAPLQISEELQTALTLNDVGVPSISPDLNRLTPPPLSSPSSLGSTPRVRSGGSMWRHQDLSPPDLNIDATVTPIAARYSRSMSNLRQKASRDAEMMHAPPVPPVPPVSSVPQDLSALLPPPQSTGYAGPGARIRIFSGQPPHAREHAYLSL